MMDEAVDMAVPRVERALDDMIPRMLDKHWPEVEEQAAGTAASLGWKLLLAGAIAYGGWILYKRW